MTLTDLLPPHSQRVQLVLYFLHLWYFVRGIKRHDIYIYIFFTNCAAFPPTIIPCFEWSRIRSASPAVTETRSHCGQRVLTLTGCRNEEHLRYIRFATGWTVTLPYWAAGVKQGLTTPPPPQYVEVVRSCMRRSKGEPREGAERTRGGPCLRANNSCDNEVGSKVVRGHFSCPRIVF